ncbi:hypothetical protein IE53DRAFT_40675 [Violaceomyces palustris]|uniref:Uncharacterized protein n=1 Tax=Violaceomyces palustris TaxID=1673888 RepID=A0ACD0P0Z1_9BASI|nr:hypothetical protein IE53DRAFT_40675 [Violaceomyces palustris]
MPESIPLYIPSDQDPESISESILNDIRSTDFLNEITSGEESPQETGLWNLVQPVLSSSSSSSLTLSQFSNPSNLLHHALQNLRQETDQDGRKRWNLNGLILVDQTSLQGDGSLLVLEVDLQKGEIKDQLRCARRSVLEVISNISISNMSLDEYRNMCGGAEVFDSGQ